MSRLSNNDILVEIGLDINAIYLFEITKVVNQHCYFKCEGILQPECGKKVFSQKMTENVKVFAGEELILSGNVQKFTTSQENEVYHFSLLASSSSNHLDITPQNYFYQNTKQAWAGVVSKAVKKGVSIATRGK